MKNFELLSLSITMIVSSQ